MIETVAACCPLCGPQFVRRLVATGSDFEYHTVPDAFQVVACCGCGVWLLDPRPSDREIARLYPENYQPYHFDQLPAPVRWARDRVQQRKVKVVRRLAPAGARIVDVGCGGGALLHLLRRFGQPDWQLVGWDFPGPHLQRVASAGFETVSAAIEAGALPDSSVDVFLMNQVLEHFARPAEVLAVLARILRPGGKLIIETPSIEGLDARWFSDRHWGGFHFPRHLVLFHARALRALVARLGFDSDPAQALPSPAFWVQSFHHAVAEHPRGRPLAGFFSIRNPLTMAVATAADLLRAPFGPTSNMRLVATKSAAGSVS